jgi:hypothetical protein
MRKLSIILNSTDFQFVLLTSVLAVILTIMSPLYLNASSSGIDFYSVDSPPPGMRSLEPLIGNWWNWWVDHPVTMSSNWPQCSMGSGGVVGNGKYVVFTANPALAVPANLNSKNQKCEISSNHLLYLTVYPGECSTGLVSGDSRSTDKSSSDLLDCAKDSNLVIKLMKVKVDGQDVSSHIIRQSTSEPFKLFFPSQNIAGYNVPPKGANNTSMAENYYLFFKPLPVGHHLVELEVIRVPKEGQVEHPVARWEINVKP